MTTGKVAVQQRTVLPKWLIRPAVHLAMAVPLIWLVALALTDQLGANPIEALIRGLGDWALRFLVLALTLTPLRRLTGWSRLAAYRRALGLWAFAYAALHLSAYVVLDQFFDWHNIGQEILKHKFITAGMAAFILLVPLAATSTQGMIRRLGGGAWRRLHRLVYLAGPLAAVHYVWMVKADIRQPLCYLAVILAGLGYRAMAGRLRRPS